LRLAAIERRKNVCVNFPLFTYSVLAKENVSQETKNIFETQQHGL